MMNKKTDIFFRGSGINSDDAREYMPKGDGVSRRNIYFPPENQGIVENMLGNTLLNHGWSHDSSIVSLKVVGSVNDEENHKSYYFILGTTASGYLNSLVELDQDTDDFTKVFWDIAELELDPDIYINDSQYNDGWIYYNGGTYGPKKVNIALAKLFTSTDSWVSGASYVLNDLVRTSDGRIYYANTATSGTTDPTEDPNWTFNNQYCYPCIYDGTTSAPLDTEDLSLINLPPKIRITTNFGSDTSRSVNNIRKKLFQFTYRFKYRDHGYGRSAPISAVTLPADGESIQGEVVNSITTNNKIILSFDGGRPGVVEYVELFVRDGNTGVWKYIGKLDAGTGTYDFYNDKALEVADDTEINTLADAVPKKCNAVEFLSENVLLLGGITEGFNNIDLSVTLTPGTEKLSLAATGALRGTFSLTTGGSSGGTYYRKVDIDSQWASMGVADGDIVKIYIDKDNPDEVVDVQFTYNDSTVTDTIFRDQCISAINNEGATIIADSSATDPPVPSIFTLTGGDFYVDTLDKGTTNINSTTSYISVYAPTSSTPNKWGGFKTGANHPFAIVYYDKDFRPFAAMRDDNTTVYVPTMPEVGGITTYEYRSNITWSISHLPPAGAVYWQWFYAGNTSVNTFWQYIVDKNTGAEGVTKAYAASGSDYTALYIHPLQTVQDIYPLSNVGPYTFQKGDRARVLTQATTADDTYGDLVTSLSDLEIIDYNAAVGTPGTEAIMVAYDSSNWSAGVSSLIEIYRPRTISDSDLLYYAFSRVYEISNGYHMGQTTNQSASSNATGTFIKGDVYFISRAFSQEVYGDGTAPDSSIDTLYLVESPAYSDFYTSNAYDFGKVNVISDVGEVYLNNIRYSNRYLQDTSINGLATFDALDYKALPNRNGQIRAMRQLGDVLRVYQEDATTSIWVGKTEYVDSSGSSTVATTSKVLGSTREKILKYGTINPESITQNDRYVYGFDALKGVFWRDSYNGMFPISGKSFTAEGAVDYKMYRYFKEQARIIRESGYDKVKVVSGWDYANDLLYVTFINYNNYTYNDTVVFNEKSNRWISFMDLKKVVPGTLAFDIIRTKKDMDDVVDAMGGAGTHLDFPTIWYVAEKDKVFGVFNQNNGYNRTRDKQIEPAAFSYDPKTGEFDGYYPIGTNANGIHDGANGASVLTDSAKNWISHEWVDSFIHNQTTGAKGHITANTATTITAILIGGSRSTWNYNDEYYISGDTGTHTGADGAAILEDNTNNWIANFWVNKPVFNITDYSKATITANTATTITGTLSDGINNVWNNGDEYRAGFGIDAHPVAAMIVADDGHIVVVQEASRSDAPNLATNTGNHNDAFLVKRSDYPYDITSWEKAKRRVSGYCVEVGDPSTYRLAYPTLHKDTSGGLYLAARRYGPQYSRLYYSSDHGVTWNNGYDIADLGATNYWAYTHIPTNGPSDTLYIAILLLDSTTHIVKECFIIKMTNSHTVVTDIAGNGAKDVSTLGALTLAELEANAYTIVGSPTGTDDYQVYYRADDGDGNPHFLIRKRLYGASVYTFLFAYYDLGWKYSAEIPDSSPLYGALLFWREKQTFDAFVWFSDSKGHYIKRYRTIDEGVTWDSGIEVYRDNDTKIDFTAYNDKYALGFPSPIGNIDNYPYGYFAQTMIWDKDSNGGGSNIAFLQTRDIVENYMTYKHRFFSFIFGGLYKHNDTSQDRATFYGEKKDVIFDFVVNEAASITKTFETLGLVTNDDWEVTEVDIAASDSYPNGMYSEIPLAYFETREGKKLTDFLRNMKTTSSVAKSSDLYEGEVLRGETMYIKMKNTSTSQVKLFKAEIGMLISEI